MINKKAGTIVRHKLTGKKLIVLKGVAVSGGGGSPYAAATPTLAVRDEDMNVYWVIEDEIDYLEDK